MGDVREINAEADPYVASLIRSLPEEPSLRNRAERRTRNPMRRDLCGRNRAGEQECVVNPYQAYITPRSVHDRRKNAGQREQW